MILTATSPPNTPSTTVVYRLFVCVIVVLFSTLSAELRTFKKDALSDEHFYYLSVVLLRVGHVKIDNPQVSINHNVHNAMSLQRLYV